PLKMAAKVDPVDHEYFQAVVKPLLEDGRVDFIGEITDEGKNAFLGQALALVCPFRPESFGLVLVESLACGTPVLAYRHGSFPEIIDHGITRVSVSDGRRDGRVGLLTAPSRPPPVSRRL
ncbi:MAG: hypothetical protein C4294_08725, partial [Nitrospiraceae bacterium]